MPKYIPTWRERCKRFPDQKIICNEDIEQVMQEEIDDLRNILEFYDPKQKSKRCPESLYESNFKKIKREYEENYQEN